MSVRSSYLQAMGLEDWRLREPLARPLPEAKVDLPSPVPGEQWGTIEEEVAVAFVVRCMSAAPAQCSALAIAVRDGWW